MAECKPRVFVPQRDDNRDFSDAKRFGDLYFVLGKHSDVYPDTDAEQVTKLRETIIEKLVGVWREGDLILLSGDPAIIAFCVQVVTIQIEIMRIPGSSLRFLKYDRDNKGYYIVGG